METQHLDDIFSPELLWREISLEELANYRQAIRDYAGEWVDYEGYMKAALIHAVPGQNGILLVKFQKNTGIEKLGLHQHNYSDRQIVVLDGSGKFHYGNDQKEVPVKSGIYLQFPRGTIHTFTTEDEDMTVLSIHRPFISLEDENCLDMYENGN
jgi:quercetin dioxygenase-like cupin family protein